MAVACRAGGAGGNVSRSATEKPQAVERDVRDRFRRALREHGVPALVDQVQREVERLPTRILSCDCRNKVRVQSNVSLL